MFLLLRAILQSSRQKIITNSLLVFQLSRFAGMLAGDVNEIKDSLIDDYDLKFT